MNSLMLLQLSCRNDSAMISFVSGVIQSGNLIFPSTTGKTPPNRRRNPAFFLEQSDFFRNQNPLA